MRGGPTGNRAKLGVHTPRARGSHGAQELSSKLTLRASWAVHDYLSPADTLPECPAMSQSPSLLYLPVTFPLSSTNPSSGPAPGSSLQCICCFKPLTFRLCSRGSSGSVLIPFPFGDSWQVLVSKQLHTKLEGGLKSRPSLTSAAVLPCNQPLPSRKL